MKTQQRKKKMKMPKTEKGNIENFLKIKYAIPLGWKEYLAFAIRAAVGPIVISLFYKLSIEAILEIFASIFKSKAPNLLPIIISSQNVFEVLQWPIYAALVAIYWFQCNIRTYNYHFTRDVERKVRAQTSLSERIRCPRCGYSMTVNSFSEKGKEQSGERTEYYTEQYRVGNDYRYRTVKKVTPEYRDVVYERQYVTCQSLYCYFEEKKPFGKDIANYKFFDMPYRISDTLHYAVWTNNNTERLTGNLRRYHHGLSILAYLFMTVLVFALSTWRGYNNTSFLFSSTQLESTLTKLGVSLAIVLGIGISIQLVTYITRKRQERTQ